LHGSKRVFRAKPQRTAFDSSLRLSVLASKKSKSSSAADVNFISRSAVVDRRKDPQIFVFLPNLSAFVFLFDQRELFFTSDF